MAKQQKKRFFHTIQIKFALLRLFVVVLILLFSIISISYVRDASSSISAVVEHRLSELRVTKELHTSILSVGLYGAQALGVAGHYNGYTGTQLPARYLEDFHASIREARMLVAAIELGSESDAFKKLDGGAPYRAWKEQGYTRYTLPTPHQEYAKYTDKISSDLDAIEASVQMVIDRYVATMPVVQLTESATTTDARAVSDEAHTFAAKTEEELVNNLLKHTTKVVQEMEFSIENKLDDDMATVGKGSSTALIFMSVFFLLVMGAILVLEIFLSYRLIAKPIAELTSTAEEMSRGYLSKRVVINSHDEVGKLGSAFNTMAKRLQEAYDNLELRIKEKTDALTTLLQEFEVKNNQLEDSQRATVNLLEDLEGEKQAVEARVRERTKEIEQEKEKLLQVTSNMYGGGILLDPAGRAIFVNQRAYELLDLDPESSYEKALTALFDLFAKTNLREQYDKCIHGETITIPEIEGNGRVFEIILRHLESEKDGVRKTEGSFVHFMDVTDAKLLERSKSELVAVASHQLRTPLTAMRGNVEMLIDESFGPLNKEQHELLDDMEISTIRLITMVNDMLDITKIEQGDLEMNLETLNVKEIVSSVTDDLASYAAAHNFEIDLEKIDANVAVTGDRVRVRQIFQNLIDNAIKYSLYPGRLEIGSCVQGNMLEMWFADNGIGIPAQEQGKLFGRFYRATNTSKTSSSGSGLGLYIVKSISQQLGGDIRFESKEGDGTTFFVTLPLA